MAVFLLIRIPGFTVDAYGKPVKTLTIPDICRNIFPSVVIYCIKVEAVIQVICSKISPGNINSLLKITEQPLAALLSYMNAMVVSVMLPASP